MTFINASPLAQTHEGFKIREDVENHVHAGQAHEADHEVLQELAEQVAVDDVHSWPIIVPPTQGRW